MATSSLDISTLDRVVTQPTTERPTKSTATTFSCTIVTSHDDRCAMFVAAAENAGWDLIQRATAADAAQPLRTSAPHLMMVDLAGNESPDEYRGLLESLSRCHGMLLLVCGNEGDPAEEIWARGLGVWLYLPGVPNDADLSSLCADALKITERNAPQTFAFPTADRQTRRRAR